MTEVHGPEWAWAGELDAASLRRAFAAFPSGVLAVAAMAGGRPDGIAVSSFTPVSLTPPLVSICIDLGSTTWPVLRSSERLGLSVLGEDHGPAARTLAAKGVDRFARVPWAQHEGGAVLVRGAALSMTCSVHAEVEAGDHQIVLLQIQTVRADPSVAPLVFHGSRFRLLDVARAC